MPPIDASTRKRLAIFFDGTWKRPGDQTSVDQLHGWTRKGMVGDVFQDAKYIPGVGTQFGRLIRGGVLGTGLSKNIREGYRWLVENYVERPDGASDQIFLFGFSRGAYSARSLAGMIARYGILRRDAAISVEELYKDYRAERYRSAAIQASTYEVEIHFMGIWDTVGALGVPSRVSIPGSRKRNRFHDTHPSPVYRAACHALALDEHRPDYDVTLWTVAHLLDREGRLPSPTRRAAEIYPRIEQRWFVGSHSDVGGGSTTPTPLSKIPLRWIQQQASKEGMVFDTEVKLDGTEHLGARGKPSDSLGTFLNGFYAFAVEKRHEREVARPIRPAPDEEDERVVQEPVNETIDPTVIERWRDDPDYPDWVGRTRLERAGIDPDIVPLDGPLRVVSRQ